MKPVKTKDSNITFAENQPEYMPLPGHAEENGLATFCFKITIAELAEVIQFGKIWITTVIFGNPMMPIKLSITKPDLPCSVDGFIATPTEYSTQKIFGDEPNKVATTAFPMSEEDLKKLKKTREFWLSMSTFGTALQPIGMSISKPKREKMMKGKVTEMYKCMRCGEKLEHGETICEECKNQ